MLDLSSSCHVVVGVPRLLVPLEVEFVDKSLYASLDHLDIGSEPCPHLRDGLMIVRVQKINNCVYTK